MRTGMDRGTSHPFAQGQKLTDEFGGKKSQVEFRQQHNTKYSCSRKSVSLKTLCNTTTDCTQHMGLTEGVATEVFWDKGKGGPAVSSSTVQIPRWHKAKAKNTRSMRQSLWSRSNLQELPRKTSNCQAYWGSFVRLQAHGSGGLPWLLKEQLSRNVCVQQSLPLREPAWAAPT